MAPPRVGWGFPAAPEVTDAGGFESPLGGGALDPTKAHSWVQMGQTYTLADSAKPNAQKTISGDGASGVATVQLNFHYEGQNSEAGSFLQIPPLVTLWLQWNAGISRWVVRGFMTATGVVVNFGGSS